MDDQKIENLLNLSLQATPEERARSLVLEEGYFPEENQWELIVKYSGDFSRAAALAQRVSYLLNEYAIVWILESRIDAFAALPEIEYIEKPKRLFFATQQGRAASCLLPVQREPLSLFGTGVLVAVIDSGVDIFNRDFQNPDGTTRIRALWDQTAPAREDMDPSMENSGEAVGQEEGTITDVSLGRVYTEGEINGILRRGGISETGRAFGGIAPGPGGFVPGRTEADTARQCLALRPETAPTHRAETEALPRKAPFSR